MVVLKLFIKVTQEYQHLKRFQMVTTSGLSHISLGFYQHESFNVSVDFLFEMAKHAVEMWFFHNCRLDIYRHTQIRNKLKVVTTLLYIETKTQNVTIKNEQRVCWSLVAKHVMQRWHMGRISL